MDPPTQSKATPMYEKHQETVRDVNNTRERLSYALRKKIREDFDHEQAVIDVRRQLSGHDVNKEARQALAAEEDMLPEQVHLLDKLMTWPTSLLIEDEWRQRSEAIDAVKAYCGIEEGDSRRGRRPRQRDRPAKQLDSKDANDGDTALSPADVLFSTTLEHLNHASRPVVCFLCFGNVNLSIDQRTRRYNRPQDLTRHFRGHLNRLGEGESTKCHFCNMPLKHKMHLQNHGRKVHRTRS